MELIFGNRGRETEDDDGARIWTRSRNILNSKQTEVAKISPTLKMILPNSLAGLKKVPPGGSWPGSEADECDRHNLIGATNL